MSLKDLLGLFDSDEKSNQSNNLNVSLQQGANFNSMQSRIEASVEPRLALIEQTTEPGLGSIIENFSGNSSEAPLAKVNTAEYKELQELEDNFNKAVSAYTQKQNAMMNDIKPKNCKNSCPKSFPYAYHTNNGFCCNKPSTENNMFCGISGKDYIACPIGSNCQDYKKCKVGLTEGAKKNQLNTMFKALQSKATELQQKTLAFHSQHQQLAGTDGQLNQQKSSTLQQLTDLQSQQSRLNKLMAEGDTLSATIHDNTLQMNAAYMRYFVWLGAAITLGLVAMHRAAK